MLKPQLVFLTARDNLVSNQGHLATTGIGLVPSTTYSATNESRSSCVFFSSRGRHTRFDCDWSSDVCSSDLRAPARRAALAVDGGVLLPRAGAQSRPPLHADGRQGPVESCDPRR